MAREQKSRLRILRNDIIDIEFKKGEDLGKAVKEVEEELKTLGVTGFERLTEKDREEIREITKNLGYKELREKGKRTAGIDNCLVGEIKDLWSKGIQTTASCCGHNIALAVISVIPEHIEKMEALGYEHFCDPKFGPARTHFKPKSVYFCMYKATDNGYPI